MKILVGLSGGVDSSVCALLLKKQGHEVIGATMSICSHKENVNSPLNKNACYGADEIEDINALKVFCKKIGIEYYVFDLKNKYEEIVLKNFKKEYIEGRTPNPCVWCNALVKFGMLPEAARQSGVEFDKFATGHYARIEEKDGQFLLKRGLDPKKDQSYFLYRLKEEQLKNIVFPVGNYNKTQIREIAREFGLDSADKKDSQDFYAGDYNELLQIKDKEGNIVDTDGKILGKHNGIWNYTIGQRKGICVSSNKPLYVLSLDKVKNEVVVGDIDKTFKKHIKSLNMSWVNGEPIQKNLKVLAKIRSSQFPVPAEIKINNNSADIYFEDYQKSPAPGQSVVFYSEDTLLGGGIIEECD